jgi:hypothetical protein
MNWFTEDALVDEVTNNNNFNEYSGMLEQASSRWGLEPNQLEDYMNRIAFHESKFGTDKYTPVQVSDKSESGYGPGRGMFQFETGLNQGGHTAANRLVDQLGYKPDWLNITDKGFDASGLNEEQQRMLFLANYMKKPEKSSGMYGVNEDNLSEWWAREHWAGDASEKDKKIAAFSGDMNVYGL